MSYKKKIENSLLAKELKDGADIHSLQQQNRNGSNKVQNSQFISVRSYRSLLTPFHGWFYIFRIFVSYKHAYLYHFDYIRSKVILLIQVKIFSFLLFLLFKVVFEIISACVQLIFYASTCSVALIHCAKLHAYGLVLANEIGWADSMGQAIQTRVKVFELVETCFLKNSVLFLL